MSLSIVNLVFFLGAHSGEKILHKIPIPISIPISINSFLTKVHFPPHNLVPLLYLKNVYSNDLFECKHDWFVSSKMKQGQKALFQA